MLTHLERLRACLEDDPALDRPPVALWRHFPVDDQDPGSLAAATLDFQAHYDFDLVKVTPASSFCLKDWGVEDAWQGSTEGTRTYTRRVVQTPADWERLSVLEPRRAPHLAAQLECLRLLRAGLGAQVPLLQTVFSPLAQARNLAEGETLLHHLESAPQAVQQGLTVIAETTRRFVAECMAAGADGIFYAVQHARAGTLSPEEYRRVALPHDRTVLEPAGSSWCNLLHLHGLQVHFELAAEFDPPFRIVNWHDRETPPSLAEGRQRFGGVVCGGISQQTIVYAPSARVREEAGSALQATGGRGLLLGTGCVAPVITPHGNLRAVRESVENR